VNECFKFSRDAMTLKKTKKNHYGFYLYRLHIPSRSKHMNELMGEGERLGSGKLGRPYRIESKKKQDLETQHKSN
jgi:hypothetical protein